MGELAPVALKPPGEDVTVYTVIALPTSETGGLNATLAWALPAVATGLVGASGTAKLAGPPIKLVQLVPLLTCNSPAVPQFVHQTISPAAGLTIAIR
jgi:hypothetical protein